MEACGIEEEIPKGYTRVTEILKPFTKFDGIKPEVLENAARRGKKVHKYCELYALGLFICHIDEDCKNYVENYKRWFDANVTEVIHVEKRCNDEILKLSGGIDLIAKIKGSNEVCLIDIKTPANPSKTWQLQTAAYIWLAANCHRVACERRFCLMLPKTGSHLRIEEYKNHGKDIELFMNAYELYKIFNP